VNAVIIEIAHILRGNMHTLYKILNQTRYPTSWSNHPYRKLRTCWSFQSLL